MRSNSAFRLVALLVVACSSGTARRETTESHAPTGTVGQGGSAALGGGAVAGMSESNAGDSNISEIPSAAGGIGGGFSDSLAAGSGGLGGWGGNNSVAGAIGCPEPIDLGVRFVGRTDGCEKDAVRFAWSGAGLVARFSGTGLSLHLRGKSNQFTMILDGNQLPTLVTKDGDREYAVASAIPAGEHLFELYRRTEASFDATSVVGFTVESGQILPPPPAPAHKIEILGDSISCGYGNEGAPCGGAHPETENHYLTYGAILARSLSAELSTVAWSGKGVVRNFDGGQVELLPLLFERVVPTEKRSIWRFPSAPQLVILNLGTNDINSKVKPTEAEFVSAYEAMLASIRLRYPSAYILCTVGPMLSGADLTQKARPYIASAVAARRAAGDRNVEAYEMTTPNSNPSCDSHPNLLTHAAMADELAQRVAPILGW